MLPKIDTQHMTCFENFTRIMDVKSMIIDQSCVTAGLHAYRQVYGCMIKVYNLFKKNKHASKRIFLSAFFEIVWSAWKRIHCIDMNILPLSVVLVFTIPIWTKSHVLGFPILGCPKWFRSHTVPDYNNFNNWSHVHVVLWDNCTLVIIYLIKWNCILLSAYSKYKHLNKKDFFDALKDFTT